MESPEFEIIEKSFAGEAGDGISLPVDFDPVTPPAIIFCDQAVVEQGTQKLSMVGCFHVFNVPGFPFQTPRFFVCVSIGNLRGIPTENDVTLRIEQAQTAHPLSGTTIHIKGDFTQISLLPDSVIQLPIPIGPLILTQPGLYKAVLLVNGNVVASRDFRVNIITANPNPQPS